MSELLIEHLTPVVLGRLVVPVLGEATGFFQTTREQLKPIRLVIPPQSRRLLLVRLRVGTVHLIDGHPDGGISCTDGLRWDMPEDVPRITPSLPLQLAVRNTWHVRERVMLGVVLWCRGPNRFGRWD